MKPTKPKENWEEKKETYDYPPKYMVDPKHFNSKVHEDIKPPK